MQYRSHRYPTQFPTPIRTPHGMQKGQVTDVNNAGAQIRGLSGVRRGDKLELDVLSHRICAVVQWVMTDRVGISFRPQISDHFVDTLRHRRDARTGMRGSVGFASAEMR